MVKLEHLNKRHDEIDVALIEACFVDHGITATEIYKEAVRVGDDIIGNLAMATIYSRLNRLVCEYNSPIISVRVKHKTYYIMRGA